MARYRVDVSEPAESDLRDIVRYISAQLPAPMTATMMMDAIEEAISGLADMPQKYPPVTDERLASMGGVFLAEPAARQLRAAGVGTRPLWSIWHWVTSLCPNKKPPRVFP